MLDVSRSLTDHDQQQADRRHRDELSQVARRRDRSGCGIAEAAARPKFD
jgi:ribosomal protein L44E